MPPQKLIIKPLEGQQDITKPTGSKLEIKPLEDPGWFDRGMALGIRTVPAVLGGMIGTLADPFIGPAGTYGGLAAGGGLGEYLAEAYEGRGINPYMIGTEAVLNTIPFSKTVTGLMPGKSQLIKQGLSGLTQGGGLGLASSPFRYMAETGEVFDPKSATGLNLPPASYVTGQTLGGAAFGGVTGGVFGKIQDMAAPKPTPNIPPPDASIPGPQPRLPGMEEVDFGATTRPTQYQKPTGIPLDSGSAAEQTARVHAGIDAQAQQRIFELQIEKSEATRAGDHATATAKDQQILEVQMAANEAKRAFQPKVTPTFPEMPGQQPQLPGMEGVDFNARIPEPTPPPNTVPPPPAAPAANAVGEPVITIRTPDAATIADLKARGYVIIPDMRSPEGFPQMVRGDLAEQYRNPATRPAQTAGATPPVTNATQPAGTPVSHPEIPHAGTLGEGEVALGGDIPNDQITPELIKAHANIGWGILEKGETTSRFKKGLPNDAGVLDIGAIIAQLRKMLGRNPTLEEIRSAQEREHDFNVPPVRPSSPSPDITLSEWPPRSGRFTSGVLQPESIQEQPGLPGMGPVPIRGGRVAPGMQVPESPVLSDATQLPLDLQPRPSSMPPSGSGPVPMPPGGIDVAGLRQRSLFNNTPPGEQMELPWSRGEVAQPIDADAAGRGQDTIITRAQGPYGIQPELNFDAPPPRQPGPINRFFNRFGGDDKGIFDPEALRVLLRKMLGREPNDAEMMEAMTYRPTEESAHIPKPPASTRTLDSIIDDLDEALSYDPAGAAGSPEAQEAITDAIFKIQNAKTVQEALRNRSAIGAFADSLDHPERHQDDVTPAHHEIANYLHRMADAKYYELIRQQQATDPNFGQPDAHSQAGYKADEILARAKQLLAEGKLTEANNLVGDSAGDLDNAGQQWAGDQLTREWQNHLHEYLQNRPDSDFMPPTEQNAGQSAAAAQKDATDALSLAKAVYEEGSIPEANELIKNVADTLNRRGFANEAERLLDGWKGYKDAKFDRNLNRPRKGDPLWKATAGVSLDDNINVSSWERANVEAEQLIARTTDRDTLNVFMEQLDEAVGELVGENRFKDAQWRADLRDKVAARLQEVAPEVGRPGGEDVPYQFYQEQPILPFKDKLELNPIAGEESTAEGGRREYQPKLDLGPHIPQSKYERLINSLDPRVLNATVTRRTRQGWKSFGEDVGTSAPDGPPGLRVESMVSEHPDGPTQRIVYRDSKGKSIAVATLTSRNGQLGIESLGAANRGLAGKLGAVAIMEKAIDMDAGAFHSIISENTAKLIRGLQRYVFDDLKPKPKGEGGTTASFMGTGQIFDILKTLKEKVKSRLMERGIMVEGESLPQMIGRYFTKTTNAIDRVLDAGIGGNGEKGAWTIKLSEMMKHPIVQKFGEGMTRVSRYAATHFILPNGDQLNHGTATHYRGAERVGADVTDALEAGIIRFTGNGAEIGHPITEMQAEKLSDSIYHLSGKEDEKILYVDVRGPKGMKSEKFQVGDSADRIRQWVNSQFIDAETGSLNVGDMWKSVKEKTGWGQGESGKQKADEFNFVKEALAVPTNATTMLDLSYPGRQGLTMVLTPQFWKAMGHMFQGLSYDSFKQIDADIRSKPIFQQKVNLATGKISPSFAEESGVKLFSPASEPGPRAEQTASRWLEMGIGKTTRDAQGNKVWKPTTGSKLWANSAGVPIRATNRAFITFANSLNANRFEYLVNKARDMSIKAQTEGSARQGIMPWKTKFTPAEAEELNPFKNKVLAKEIADFVNTATGHGPLKTHVLPFKQGEVSLEAAAGKLGYVLFSPGLLASRVRMLNPNTYIMASPFVRKQYLKAALSTVAAWYAYTELAKAAGGKDVDVNNDWTSADFGKIRIGNARLDPAGGFLQFAVAVGRMWEGGSTSSASGEFKPFGSGYQAQTQEDMFERFFVNKLNPMAKFAYDLGNASEYNPFHMGDRTMQLFVPLIMQDMYEIAKTNPDLLPTFGTAALFGGGTQVYERGESVAKFIPEEDDWLVKGGGGGRALMPWNWGEQQENMRNFPWSSPRR